MSKNNYRIPKIENLKVCKYANILGSSYSVECIYRNNKKTVRMIVELMVSAIINVMNIYVVPMN
ncbi:MULTISPECIES: hypothetical protein [unclassified Clostridium]|uniref:hypothetical protein n=1 Tax=unclassified Clostridium TaxID=2614128 RepID=UPI00061E8C3F|nr:MULTISPECIES: hypothetical protein [unclassified Clostridium]KJZ83949.1 hypothetical protein ClosIBUN125C_CONTIG68g03842 [Clostridium sp. IBUN125C]KJZ85435.1 hypothetical protein ClosIBUN13A_CONTIG74g00856 [Clostridium sp. IBUN13A]KJZ90024.1 hypothetical protein ClosIBUN22A_CONTIG200g04043 [Clostridium sp. IBUN22A]KJZ93430.1 hypothetical protein ClosIBUN62F_CONTIG43g01566 [Clostridium sp. IBUN62F]